MTQGIITPTGGHSLFSATDYIPTGWVLHIIGQSNAAGRGGRPTTLANNVGIVLPNGVLLTQENTPTDVAFTFGVEMPLADTWPIPDSIVLVKTGVGGSSAQQWLDTHWTTHVATYDAATALPTLPRHVVIWIQGESDANNDEVSSYAARTNELFDRISNKFDNALIVDVTLNEADVFNGPPDPRNTRSIALNVVKRDVAAARSDVSIIENTFNLSDDKLHYDEQGLVEMGAAILARLQSLYNPFSLDS